MIWLGWGMAVNLLAAVAAVVLRRRGRLADRAFRLLVSLSTLLGTIAALRALRAGAVPIGFQRGPWAFGLDPLSAWFLLIMVAVGGTIAVYGPTYLAPERGHRSVASAHVLMAVLLIALAGVVTAQSIPAFLASWEIMAVGAYLLVVYEREKPAVRRAGLIYVLLTHASMLALIGMFASFGGAGFGLTFADTARQHGGFVPAAGPMLAFALLGFGIKAGAVPLHFWLPGAHAAAPSHVSALLSGVMLKAGVYGLLRVVVLVGTPPAWWGWTLLTVGLVSGILGVLWALAQHDLKRLLAYHSVENIGIIFMGLGVGSLGLAYGHPAIAVLGFAGALLHALNHALFKSLLFLGAGAVIRATGARRMDQLGGVGRGMPLTALAFGIGAAAIVGLPPLNGFVSEWVIFLSLIRAGGGHDATRLAAAGAAGLALIGGLALACFAKVTGVIFLGRPRASVERLPADPEPGMSAPTLLLAGACLAIGLAPAIVLGPVLRVAATLVPSLESLPDPGLPAASGISLLAALLLGTTAVLFLVGSRRRRPAGSVRPETWACGGLPDLARTQYTASSFAAPLLAAYAPMAGLHETRSAGAYAAHATDPVLDGAVRPLWRAVDRTSHWVRAVQSGRIRWYLLAVVFTLLGLLLRLATGGGNHP